MKTGYENRLSNISYIEERELVQKEVGALPQRKCLEWHGRKELRTFSFMTAVKNW